MWLAKHVVGPSRHAGGPRLQCERSNSPRPRQTANEAAKGQRERHTFCTVKATREAALRSGTTQRAATQDAFGAGRGGALEGRGHLSRLLPRPARAAPSRKARATPGTGATVRLERRRRASPATRLRHRDRRRPVASKPFMGHVNATSSARSGFLETGLRPRAGQGRDINGGPTGHGRFTSPDLLVRKGPCSSRRHDPPRENSGAQAVQRATEWFPSPPGHAPTDGRYVPSRRTPPASASGRWRLRQLWAVLRTIVSSQGARRSSAPRRRNPSKYLSAAQAGRPCTTSSGVLGVPP